MSNENKVDIGIDANIPTVVFQLSDLVERLFWFLRVLQSAILGVNMFVFALCAKEKISFFSPNHF